MLTRRGFLAMSVAACARPLIKTSRPSITHGVQVGDPQAGRALVWARCDEPARMIVEWSTRASLASPRRVAGPVVTPDGDRAATVALEGLPDGQTIAYRVRFEREAERGASEWVTGRFATPRSDSFRFAWTGDTCGQGFGRNPEWGGLRGYAAIRDANPAFLLHSGDLIYADNPIPAEKTVGGRVWRNITNERVARVAQELDDFRARFAYNLEDEHVRALTAEVPIVAQWDDHETHDDWWPGEQIPDPRYRVRDASALSLLARRALFEWTPLPPGSIHRVVRYGPLLDLVVLDCRSFRTPNDGGDGTKMLGDEQAAWLVDTLRRSSARWKIVATDTPLGLVSEEDGRNDGWSNSTPGVVGRKVELERILRATRDVRGIVWLTADVHYAAAHSYQPADLAPFWEFVAGPIHAGTFGPNALDPTFRPELKFQWAPEPGQENLPPWDGLQSFGTVDVSRDALAVALWGIDGKQRYRVELS